MALNFPLCTSSLPPPLPALLFNIMKFEYVGVFGVSCDINFSWVDLINLFLSSSLESLVIPSYFSCILDVIARGDKCNVGNSAPLFSGIATTIYGS